MKQQTDLRNNLAGVNLDQWRQEIEVFAAATKSALDAIVNELSNACSGDVAPTGSSEGIASSAVRQTSTDKQANSDVSAKFSGVLRSSARKKPSLSQKSGRLASIKEKLASRINRNKN